MSDATCVLDASALLAMLHEEPGGDEVEARISEAAISSVNWSEVVQKSLTRGVDVEGMREDLEALGLSIHPFDADDAEAAAELLKKTKEHGLSLADGACLTLAGRHAVEALTTDRVWKEPDLGSIEVRVVR